MEDRPLSDPLKIPTDNELFSILGNTSDYYKEINEFSKEFKRLWNFSKRSGWMQKVFDNKKALFYFIPLKHGFKISLAIREEEKIKFIKDTDLKVFSDQFNNSRKYSEGYAMLFEISDAGTFNSFKVFLNKLIEERK